jgi:hypothetical protein
MNYLQSVLRNGASSPMILTLAAGARERFACLCEEDREGMGEKKRGGSELRPPTKSAAWQATQRQERKAQVKAVTITCM